MLSLKLQLAMILLSVASVGYILYLISREIIELKYSIIWIIIGILLLVISIHPQIVASIATLLGIGLPVNTLYLFAIFSVLMIIMVLTVAISKVSLKYSRLAQEIALLRDEVQEAKKRKGK